MGKPKRLSKVAGEFNLGLNTVIEYLSSKGFEVESNPNSKITPDMYEVLVSEFHSDKSIKEQSGKIEIKKVKKETISIEQIKVEPKEEEDLPVEQELIIKSNAAEPKVPVEELPEKEVEVQKGLKVLGKIDLAAFNKKGGKQDKVNKAQKDEVQDKVNIAQKDEVQVKVNKAQKDEVQDKVVEQTPIPIVAEVLVEENKETKSETKSESKVDVKIEEEVKQDANTKPIVVGDSSEFTTKTQTKEEEIRVMPVDDVVRAKADRLTGPKVLGKIELPVDRRREAEELKKKKKRKRIKKDVTPPAAVAVTGEVKKDGLKPPFNNNKKDVRGVSRFKKEEKKELTDEDVQKQIRETLARLSGGKQKNKSAKFRRQKRDNVAQRQLADDERSELENKILKVTEFISANELATLMEVTVNEVISACMSLGLFVSINQRLDAETIAIVAEEFGFQVSFVDAEEQNIIEEEVDTVENLKLRAPIVTVMGHVDHGKTSLLDKIRNATVADGEAGGITQHIGAYSVLLEGDRRVTFLDTPGHEAFTAMRARGAKLTDIAIIIIAADDSVMPQTIEAINHAQAANVPMVFAINKIDKPGANPDKIREVLANMNILVEDWGGKFQCQEISAKNNIGIEELLEKVLIESELMELKANPDKRAKGIVVESALDKGRGFVTTILVENGTLKIGDIIVTGSYFGKVKAMFDDKGNRIKEAGPSVPVQILGLNGAPQAGDVLNVMDSDKEAKDIANKRLQLQREQGIRTQKHITLDEIGRRIAVGNFKELNLIIKGDVDGSIEALTDSLLKLSTEQIQVNVIHKSVGQISESDVLLATASDAIIIGFQVRPSSNARKIAEQEEIEIRLYSVIYQAIEEIKDAMEGMLAPTIVEKIVANVEIREVFKISKVGSVAGCYVLDGKINRNNKIRIIRDGIVKYDGALGSLKRFKEDVKDVAASYECGLNVDKYNDIKEGDIIEAYEEVEVKQKLA